METKSEDICVIPGYRLTENKVYYETGIVETYFNIRDEQGRIHGRNFDEIEWPLNLLLCINNNMESRFQLDKTTYKVELQMESTVK